MHSDQQHERPRRHRGGPLLVLFAVLLFCLSLAYLHEDRAGGVPAPPAHEAQTGVPGWVGRLDEADGLRLYARLTRLHAQPQRQEFDSKALARHFGLGPGEPWRLTLRLVDEGEAAPRELRLGELAVRAGAEPGLRAATRRARSGEAEIADPLGVLLAPPEVLRAGQEAQLVLWGSAPVGVARLEGVELARSEEADGLAVELVLEQRVLAPSPGESVLASLGVFARSGKAEEEVEGAQQAVGREE